MADADDSTRKYRPLTEDLVRKTLKEDKGEAAQLVSWRCEDFTKKGDNYACLVTSVKVEYRDDEQGEPREVSYVAKIAHQVDNFLTEWMNNSFLREGTSFMEILPKANEIMKELHLDSIRTAKGYCGSYLLGKEVLMLEDLRQRHFKMYDRRRDIDVPHANLVLKELGRLHAASLLLEKKLRCSLTETWPLLVETWLTEDSEVTNVYQKITEGQMEASAMVAEKTPKYEHVATWMRDNKANGFNIIRKDVLNSSSKFVALTHGDCWNNNVMFRYDEAGTPVEVMLVDLQKMRRASVAIDLSYFLYVCLNGDVRKNNLEHFLATYYDSFISVLRPGELSPPFSLEELLQEFKDKIIFGCVAAMMVSPLMLSEEQDTMNFFDIKENDMDHLGIKQQDRVLRMIKRDGHFRDRILSIFDEMVGEGIGCDVAAAP